jgi:DNA polymerase/3'-5' exonuclease PolX
MSDGTRIPLSQAEPLAHELLTLLAPVTTRAEIAGSIRRRQATVGDIELLVEPAFAELPDLFGGSGQRLNLLDEQVAEWLQLGVVEHRLDKNNRPSCGERYKRLRFGGVALDLFVCLPPAQWGVLFVIRTGPAEYGHRLVTPRSQGGWCPDYLQVKDGALRRRDDGTILPTPEERHVFDLLGREYAAPEQRFVGVPV